jgi:O-acetyl-ADP-ribose deacetylase (regulator of RNase III)
MLENAFAMIRRWRMRILKPFANLSSECVRISLGDLNPEVARALATVFQDVADVEVVEGNLLDLASDAIVSPANSFGDMGGGIDKAIDDFHGGAAQIAVTAAIAEHHFGELPVGTALIVRLSSRRFPFIVAAPTMRIPGNVIGTINAYLSMRAALVTVLRHNLVGKDPIRGLAVPGLCTGVGGISPDEAAQQMRVAYDSVIGGQWRQVVHSAVAPYATGNKHLPVTTKNEK